MTAAVPPLPADPDALVRTLDLSRTYGKPPNEVRALRGVSLEIRRGERVALLGKSGSGKSTLLNVLGGLDRPSSGRVQVAGRDLTGMRSNQLARHRLTTVGIVFQSFNLVASRSALQNVELPMVFAGRPPRERRAAARRVLEAVGLGHRLDHRPGELSGGEQQRVAIARALVNRPQVLLADEPTGNLDSATGEAILTLLRDLREQLAMTVVMVTHERPLAERFADRLATMGDGKLLGVAASAKGALP